MQPYLEALTDLFYPQWCVACDERASDVLCRSCVEALPLTGRPACGRCGLPTAFETPACDECRGVDLAFDSARAPLRYEGAGKALVHALKYRAYKPVVEKVAAPLIAETVRHEGPFEAVVPVPLHRSRLRKRGFNQAELLARGVAGRIGASLSDTLQAVRSTRDQVKLSAAERRANVADAFTAGARAKGKVLLVDDVFTTGATTSACAAALLKAGAAEIHAVTLCRTV